MNEGLPPAMRETIDYVERRRVREEMLVREYDCPDCGAKKGERCRTVGIEHITCHYGRYKLQFPNIIDE